LLSARFIIAGSLVFTCKTRRCSFLSTAGRFNICSAAGRFNICAAGCFFTCAADGGATMSSATITAADVLNTFSNLIIICLP